MKIPKLKKSTLIFLLIFAVFMTVVFFTTPMFRRDDKKVSSGLSGGNQDSHSENNNHYTSLSEITLIDNPDLENKTYPANDVAGLLSGTVHSKLYTEIYLPDDYFLENELPEGQKITIFEAISDANVPTAEEKAEFLNDIFENLLEKAHFPLSITVTKNQIPSPANPSQMLTWRDGIYQTSAFFGSHYTYLDLSVSDHFYQFQLDRMSVSVDQTASDDEITQALKNIRLTLCEILGVNLQDTKIVRTYDDRSENGAAMLDVYFYNKDAHSANALLDTTPKSDYIRLSFDNDPDFKGDFVSGKKLTNVSIAFVKYYKINTSFANANMISPETAKEMLNAGHVFGVHACELCMQSENVLDFSCYDHVRLVYKSTSDGGLMPFYAFYKALKKTDNGSTKYALTYVPAFEVTDIEAYFESQKENHNSFN